MLNRTLALGLLVAAGLAGTLCARAADMPALFPQPSYPDVEPAPQMYFGTGWYLRGDLTASDDLEPSVLGSLASSRRNWGWGAGGGAGYQFTDYFRADITGDWLSSERRSSTVFGVTDKARMDRWDGLVNGYVDLGNWAGLTPYIGAGIGVASLNTKGSTTDPTIGPIGSRTDYNMAWAAMAGIAYHISPHLLLDVGYRYLDLGTYRPPQRTLAQQTIFNGNKTDLNAHEVRVGLRYQID